MTACPRCSSGVPGGRTCKGLTPSLKSTAFYTRDEQGREWRICIDCGLLFVPGGPRGSGVSVLDEQSLYRGRRPSRGAE